MEVLNLLCLNLTSLLLAGAAFYLASKDKEGWGWFLFAAIVTVNW